MPARFRILFLGIAMGGVAFLAAGFACSLIIEQVQYSALDARVGRAVIAATRFRPEPRMPRSWHTLTKPKCSTS